MKRTVVMLLVMGAAFSFGSARSTAQSPAYAVRHSFTNRPSDGGQPGELFRRRDAVLYGATSEGGQADGGTLFKVNPDGSGYRIVADLPSSGSLARAQFGSDDLIYGLVRGGSGTNGGAVIRLLPDGSSTTVLHRFESVGDGRSPTDLLEGSDGELYGSTAFGGTAGIPPWGTVFKLHRDGSAYRVLRSFSLGPGEGGQVYGIMEGSDGALYGTCAGGGLSPGAGGTLFQLAKDGTGYVVRHLFTGDDGNAPHARLTEGTDGALYGTCSAGGPYHDGGTLFKMARDGSSFVVLHAFAGSLTGDGAVPHGRLLEGTDGILYGTTAGGGSAGSGTVFSIKRDGTGYQILRSLQPSLGDGWDPYAGLVEGANGLLLGTTSGGGNLGAGERYGTVFQIAGPVGPRLRLGPLEHPWLTVTWPSSWAGLALEEKNSLAAGSWTSLTVGPQDDGTNQTVRVELGAASKFYRLSQP